MTALIRHVRERRGIDEMNKDSIKIAAAELTSYRSIQLARDSGAVKFVSLVPKENEETRWKCILINRCRKNLLTHQDLQLHVID